MTMEMIVMKRKKNQYKIAAVCLSAAILGMAGVAFYNEEKENQKQEQQIAENEQKKEKEQQQELQKEMQEETADASAVIEPRQTDTAEMNTAETDTAKAEAETEQKEQTENETAATSAKPSVKLHFNAKEGLRWPVNGEVLMDYNMEQTVYFATLDQYKYNPAMIISGNINDKVCAAADGKITDISVNEETGCTMTMDLGDGYTAVYGQLKEVPYHKGAYVEAGNTIGFVSEPTKYYSVEGSNLYFELKKDGVSVNPTEFFAG